MTSDKPSATNPAAARIDEFLGRATSFMAIYGVSDPGRLSQLAIIADQLGLTNQEYQAAMLRLREHQEFAPTPKAKPLPRTLPTDASQPYQAPPSPPPSQDDSSSRCAISASDPLRESFLRQAKLLLAHANANTPEKLRTLAVQLGRDGIRVNAVAPSYLKTPFNIGSAEKLEATAEAFRAFTPLGRLGTPEDVAGAIAFLASDRASFITGDVIHVCGGSQLAPTPQG